MPVNTRLHQLAKHGQSVWIDFLSRDLLGGGELARMTRRARSSVRHGRIPRTGGSAPIAPRRHCPRDEHRTPGDRDGFGQLELPS